MTAVVVASLADLEPEVPVRVLVGEVPVALVRLPDGDVHAIGDTCSHANVSLAEGEVEDCTISCWLHGSTFDLRTGHPLSLPAIRPVPVYPVTIDGDAVSVDVTTTLGEAPVLGAPGLSVKES